MSRRRAAGLVVLALLAGCARCGASRSATSAEELLPATSAGSVILAPLGALAQHAAALVEKAASLPGGEQLGDYRKALAAQLGFDPLTREGLLAAGLDPDRGAAISFQPGQPGSDAGRLSWMIALPLTNAEVFAQRFDQVARERAGYAQRTDQPLGGTRIALYENGSKQRLAQAVVRGYGLVGRGPEAAAEIAATASRGRAQSLAQEPRLASARLKIGAQDLIAFAPSGSELPRRWVARPLPGDVLLGLSGSAQGVTARLFAQLPQTYAQIALALIPGGGAALAGLLPAAAPVRARLGLAPSLVPSQLARIPALAAPLEELRAAMKSSGADLDQDLFGALEPGLVFSIGVSPRINLGRTVDLSFLDWRHRSPFDTFQLVALAGVHDKPRLLRALAAVAQTLPLFGAKAARSGDDFAVTYAAAQAGSQAPPAAPQEGARFGVRSIAGKDVAYLLGAFAPEALTDAAGKSGPPVFFGDPGLVLLLDVGKLAATLHALPEEAYGSGPQTYVAHSIVNQAVEPLKPLRLTASAQALPEGISAELVLEIVAAP